MRSLAVVLIFFALPTAAICPPGSHIISPGTSCSLCPVGTYQPNLDQTSCLNCGAGLYNPATGSSSAEACVQCEPGKSAITEKENGNTGLMAGVVWGTDECTDCPAGSYAETAGAKKCTPCPADAYNPTTGAASATACLPCPPGLTGVGRACIDTAHMYNNVFTVGPGGIAAFSRQVGGFASVTKGDDGHDHGHISNPYSHVFVEDDTLGPTLLVASTGDDEVQQYHSNGTFIGVFATLTEPSALLYLPDSTPPLLAVGLDDFTNDAGDNLKLYDLSGSLLHSVLLEKRYRVRDLVILNADYILVEAFTIPEGGVKPRHKWFKVCIPSQHMAAECTQDGMMVAQEVASVDFQIDIANQRYAIIPSSPTYLMTMSDTGVIGNCQIQPFAWQIPSPPCGIFKLFMPGTVRPELIFVDDEQQLVFVTDGLNSQLLAFDYFGRAVGEPISIPDTSAITTKPGSYPPFSQFTAPLTANATAPITIPLTLRDRFDNSIPLNPADTPHFEIFAEGLVTTSGISFPLTITGVVSSSPAVILATINIQFAGAWSVHITADAEPVHAAPLILTVSPGATDFSGSTIAYETLITAGDEIAVNVSTADIHGNPTPHAPDEFVVELQAGVDLTKSGTYLFAVTQKTTGEMVGGRQYGIRVQPAPPSAAKSTHNINSTELTSQAKRTVPLELRVVPVDEFGNLLLTEDHKFQFQVAVDGDVHNLTAPDFSYTHAIPKGYDANLVLSFTLDGLPINNSPITVVVSPDGSDLVATLVATCLAVALLLLCLVARRRDKAASKTMRKQSMNLRSMKESLHDTTMLHEAEKEKMEAQMRRQKHSSEELLVMALAMKELDKERKDELAEVLIDGKELQVERLLGKGGFGVVNLAIYRGKEVAMKQLLTIESDSVKRFRFECFLMKKLRHPNIVELVGVCWDDDLFACCLEFVENGSLEDWLRRTAGGKVHLLDSSESTLADRVSAGWDPLNQYDEDKFTALDLQKRTELLDTLKRFEKELNVTRQRGGGSVNAASGKTAKKEELSMAERLAKAKELQGTNQAQIEKDVGSGNVAEPDDNHWAHGASTQTFAGSFFGTSKESNGWTALSGFPSVSSFSRYREDDEGKWAEALARVEINAPPSQVAALHSSPDFVGSDTTSTNQWLDRGLQVSHTYFMLPSTYWVLSNRDMMWRHICGHDAGAFFTVLYSVDDERRPEQSGVKRVTMESAHLITEKAGSEGKLSVVKYMRRIDLKISAAPRAVQALAAKLSVEATAGPLDKLKRVAEELMGGHVKKERTSVEITWKGQLLQIAVECALGVQYLHHERYWAEEEVQEKGVVVEAGYRECIIHRDLKPDNMLLTKDWKLKLTDFGEARAVNLNASMTSVGTPIYVAPEVMRGYQYNASCDSYSFGIILVAMIRGEKNVIEFYFQALRKSMKRKTKNGVGITILNTRMYAKGWRPLLPKSFKCAFPKMHALIERCWSQDSGDRPNFDEIVKLMQGDISDEVRRGGEEPQIVMYSDEDDSVYHERLAGGLEENVLKEKEVRKGGGEDMVSEREFLKLKEELASVMTWREHKKVVEKKDAKIEELQKQLEVSSRRQKKEPAKDEEEPQNVMAMMGGKGGGVKGGCSDNRSVRVP